MWVIISASAAQRGLWPPRPRGGLITHNDATVGRNPPDECRMWVNKRNDVQRNVTLRPVHVTIVASEKQYIRI
jgi:hypothetical protein